jgi:hypothetical protein
MVVTGRETITALIVASLIKASAPAAVIWIEERWLTSALTLPLRVRKSGESFAEPTRRGPVKERRGGAARSRVLRKAPIEGMAGPASRRTGRVSDHAVVENTPSNAI